MKVSPFLISILFLFIGCGISRENSRGKKEITIKGSDTALPLTQRAAESFLGDGGSTAVTMVGGGSGVGIAALIDGTTDIAVTSREPGFSELVRLKALNDSVEQKIIAYDALAVIVHPSNPIAKLTREQIESIFTGKLTNWKEVGGEDRRIIVYARESSSGTYDFFKAKVMHHRNYFPGVLNMPATGAIVQAVSQTEGAIGYIGFAYETKLVKALAVSFDSGKTYVTPTVENARTHTYPVVRPLYFLYRQRRAELVEPFVSYILSGKGQAIVAELGYIPVY